MKYYIIAGEASGDMHAAHLITAIRKKETEARFRGWGGDQMERAGCEVVKHYKDLAFMGFWEVFTHLRTVLRNFAECRKDILDYRPDVLILVDYPGFNLRMARFAKENKIRVVYYISPQVWAWKKGRIRQIKAYVDDMLVILPFETDFYAKYHYPVHYVGHPLLDEMASFDPESPAVRNFRNHYGLDNRPIIALIPGSRKQEIKTMLPLMVKTARRFPEYQFVISAVKWQPRSLYDKITTGIPLIEGNMYPMLRNATAAIVTSGTASLETSLMDVPQTVVYKGSWISYFIARHLIKDIRYISLTNLILDKQVFHELIQGEVTPDRIEKELNLLLKEEDTVKEMRKNYALLRKKLGNGGASDKAADIIIR